MGIPMPQNVSIVRTASTVPERSISNREIGELLTAGVRIDDEAAADIVAKTRERSELIEKKTGLRGRRFFPWNRALWHWPLFHWHQRYARFEKPSRNYEP